MSRNARDKARHRRRVRDNHRRGALGSAVRRDKMRRKANIKPAEWKIKPKSTSVKSIGISIAVAEANTKLEHLSVVAIEAFVERHFLMRHLARGHFHNVIIARPATGQLNHASALAKSKSRIKTEARQLDNRH